MKKPSRKPFGSGLVSRSQAYPSRAEGFGEENPTGLAMNFDEETVEGHSFPRPFITEAAHHPRTKRTNEQTNKRLSLAAEA
jgi:hypothetical protein